MDVMVTDAGSVGSNASGHSNRSDHSSFRRVLHLSKEGKNTSLAAGATATSADAKTGRGRGTVGGGQAC